MRVRILNAYVRKITKNKRRVGLTKAEAPTKAVGAFCDLRHIKKNPESWACRGVSGVSHVIKNTQFERLIIWNYWKVICKMSVASAIIAV